MKEPVFNYDLFPKDFSGVQPAIGAKWLWATSTTASMQVMQSVMLCLECFAAFSNEQGKVPNE